MRPLEWRVLADGSLNGGQGLYVGNLKIGTVRPGCLGWLGWVLGVYRGNRYGGEERCDQWRNTIEEAKRDVERALGITNQASESPSTGTDTEERAADSCYAMLMLCGELGGKRKDEAISTYLRRLLDRFTDLAIENDKMQHHITDIEHVNAGRNPPLAGGRDQIVDFLRMYSRAPYADPGNETVRVRAVLLSTAADELEKLQKQVSDLRTKQKLVES